MEKWLTIKELAARVNMSYSTAYRYLEMYDKFFLKDYRGRGKRFEAESSVVILSRIQYLFQTEGLSSQGVEETLAQEFAVVVEGETPAKFASVEETTPFVTRDDMLKIFERMGQYMETLEQKVEKDSEIIEELSNEVKLLKDEAYENKEILKAIQELSTQEAAAAKERDEQVTKLLTEWREERSKEPVKKPWWKFGKN